MADPHGNFPQCPEGFLALGLIHRWRSDPALSELFARGGGIREYEVETLLREDGLKDLTLGVFIDSTLETPNGANRRVRLETAIANGLVRSVRDREGTDAYLVHRVFNHMKALVAATDGEVLYEDRCVGNFLRFEQPPPVVIAGGTMLLYVLRIVCEQMVRGNTREVIYE